MKIEPTEQSTQPHWSAQMPWLLAFLGIVVTGVLRFDNGLSNQLKTTQAVADAQGEVLIELNTASQAELEQLPDIGVILSRRIIEQRPFASVGDLKRVHGIGPKLMERLLPRVTVKSANAR